MKIPQAACRYFSELGKKGGKTTGAHKRRSKAFYVRISALGLAARRAKKEAANNPLYTAKEPV